MIRDWFAQIESEGYQDSENKNSGLPIFAHTTVTYPTRRVAAEPPHRPYTNGWPLQGKIQFKNLSVRYRDDTPLVLNGESMCT
jgi:hypothetical protein